MATQSLTQQTALEVQLDQIQGNILAGFNKDFQEFLFVRFTDKNLARAWLKSIVDDIATCDEVLAFNALFKKVRKRRHGREGTIKATWLNVGFTVAGLQAVGVDLTGFPDDFRQGMKARHNVESKDPPGFLLGDVGDSDPAHWIEPFKSSGVHAVIHLASDALADLNAEASRQVGQFNGGVHLVYKQEGRTRMDAGPDQVGHEHFGFKDGVSQPGIHGVDAPNPDQVNHKGQANPGQDLLWPGEFVLGYPTQPGAGADDPEAQGPISSNGPGWTKNGSYLVFRRLRQDVKAFHDFVAAEAARQGISPEVMGAKFVGRYKSGAPLERTKDEPVGFVTTNQDPSTNGALGFDLLDDDHINNFEYAAQDAGGGIVPRAAHIRKTYPRDELTPGGGFRPGVSEQDTQTRRLLRRGIPFGASFKEGAPKGSPAAADAAFPHDRGLLFLAYQHSIERHFEFVQSVWVNNVRFPGTQPDDGAGPDGVDPIISQSGDHRPFSPPVLKNPHLTLPKSWVVTTGGDYFFVPSIDALKSVLSGQ